MFRFKIAMRQRLAATAVMTLALTTIVECIANIPRHTELNTRMARSTEPNHHAFSGNIVQKDKSQKNDMVAYASSKSAVLRLAGGVLFPETVLGRAVDDLIHSTRVAWMKITRQAPAENDGVSRRNKKLFAILGAGILSVNAFAFIFGATAIVPLSPMCLLLTIPFTYATILQVVWIPLPVSYMILIWL